MIYLHIPFCISKCFYCSFTSKPNPNAQLVETYVDFLLKEITLRSDENFQVDSIYFGGGTPTLLSAKTLEKILNKVRASFNVQENAEITFEANPKTVTDDHLSFFKNENCRLSLGVQSLNDKELTAVNRAHTRADALKILDKVSKTLTNFSCDLMLGLPFQEKESLSKSLSEILSFSPSHMSLYGLSLEEGTPLFDMVNKSQIVVADGDTQANLFEKVAETLQNAGFEHYEISNFAKNKAYSSHNLGYWQLKNYFGFGLSAHSYEKSGDGFKRSENPKTFNDYFEILENGKSPATPYEFLGSDETMWEFVMLALRTTFGVNLKEFKNRFSVDFLEKYKLPLAKMKNYLEVTEEKVSILPEFFYSSNSIIVEFSL